MPVLAYQIITKMIALKSNSQANGILPSTPLYSTELKNNLSSNIFMEILNNEIMYHKINKRELFWTRKKWNYAN